MRGSQKQNEKEIYNEIKHHMCELRETTTKNKKEIVHEKACKKMISRSSVNRSVINVGASRFGGLNINF